MGNSESEEYKINPSGGFKHFGIVKGDYVILRGSIPGTYSRMVKLRTPVRPKITKINPPKILEIMI